MEHAIIYLIGVILTTITVYYLTKRKYTKLLKHQEAINAVLRFRLKEKQELTLDELKGINVWSGKAINKIYKRKKQLEHFANTGYIKL